MKPVKILFAGGGSGGHVMPVIAIARELRRLRYPQDPSADVPGNQLSPLALYYLGPRSESAFAALAQEGIAARSIVSGKLRRYVSFRNLVDVLLFIPIGFIQSFFFLLFMRPRLIFSKGGTGSLPVTFSARMLMIPVFIHESDMVPGLSNRATSAWAKKFFISFEKTEQVSLQKTVLVGNPIRKELLEGTVEGAKETFGLVGNKPVVLFLGGSQGAEPINDFVLLMLNDLLQSYEVIHVCGARNYRRVQLEAGVVMDKKWESSYHLKGSLDEVALKHAYKVSSLIVSRAGAASIFEIAAVGKPSILIPLPTSAQDHQSKNAYAYARTGAAIVVEQTNLTPHFFLGEIQAILSQRDRMEEMRKAALAFARPLAAKAIAREILEYLG